ncbi:hypothetical protein AZE42_02251 [Rhizopogon vesiculosus]|uniref:Uncharacterized protein n=1 Tax=Rhizopogon vesiculosus TaxID=180088 RepID=A0A1J8Q8N1_9AGAM|nr:hypothetical protein AZE42_02251 [Rhizopogon vesiculosus]
MSSTSENPGLSLSPTTIAGIVIAAVAGIALLAGAYLFLRRFGGSRGRFTRLRRRRAAVDPDEEFVSRESSLNIRDRGYGHHTHPSVSLDPLLPPSPPQTYALQDIPAFSGPFLPRDRSCLPSPVDPVLPPIDLGHFSLYDFDDDPYARIQRAILPVVSPAPHVPVPLHMPSQELDPHSKTPTKHAGPSAPLFINRTLTRPLGSELSSGRTGASFFPPAELPQAAPSRTRNNTTQSSEPLSRVSAGDTNDVSQTKSRRLISKTALAERAILNGSKEEVHRPHRAGGETLNAGSSHPSTPYTPPYPDPPTSPISRESFRRLTRPQKPRGLSPVAEISTSNPPPSHDISMTPEITTKRSITLSSLDTSSSLSVALSHTDHARYAQDSTQVLTPFPLLSSSNTFGKSDSTSSSQTQRWTISSSSRYPSLTLSSHGPPSSRSSSNRHSDSAVEWHRLPAGLAAFANIQLEPATGPTRSPSPRSKEMKIPDLPKPPAHRLSPPPAADKRRGVKPRQARLRAHSPGSVAEVERGPIVQGGIASIDVAL